MGYMNVSEVDSALRRLAEVYPERAHRVRLPYLTHEGRRCWALRIGETRRRKQALLVTGCVHAREWGGADIGVYWLADLLEAATKGTGLRYGDSRLSRDALASALDRLDVIVMPQVNPDGRDWSQRQDALWRGNRNPESVSAGGYGVDLNRNHDFLWDFPTCFHPDADVATTTSATHDSQTWRGPSPGSEPETRNLEHLFDSRPEIRWYVDLHSYGPTILYPWGDDEDQSVDPSQSFQNPAWNGKRGVGGDGAYREYIPSADRKLALQLGRAMANAIEGVRGQRYGVEPAYSLYPTSGAGDDWAYSRHFVDTRRPRVLPFTLEFGRELFAPEWSVMRPVVLDVCAALTALLAAASEASSPL